MNGLPHGWRMITVADAGQLDLGRQRHPDWPPGTLLVAMYGEGKTRGRVAELGLSATTNQACAAIVLRSPSPRLRSWMKVFLEANYHGMRRMAAGGVQPNLSLGLIRSMKVPIPDEPVMEELVSRVQQARDVARRLGQQIGAAAKRSVALRRALLAAAVAGRLTERTNADVEELAGG